MKKLQRIIIYTCLLTILSAAAYAQAPSFSDDIADDVPLDGGVSALVVAAAAYGYKKLRNKTNNDI